MLTAAQQWESIVGAAALRALLSLFFAVFPKIISEQRPIFGGIPRFPCDRPPK
jgi:hypothetical protein